MISNDTRSAGLSFETPYPNGPAGGGISRRSDVLVEPIRAFNAAHGYGRSCPKQPRIMSAELFGDAGIIGAALLGKGK